jgi:hypothetical protein
MSTNYNARIASPQNPNETLEFHIGQTAMGTFLMSTAMFPSFDAMMDFIEYNAARIEVSTEYGTPIDPLSIRTKLNEYGKRTLTSELERAGFYREPSGHTAYAGEFI